MPKVTKETEIRQKEAFLLSLGGGKSIIDSAEAAGVNRVTAWRWRKSKRFKEKVLAIIDSRTQTVEDALYASALKGNVVAQIFWLKNRAKDRWSDVQEHKLSGIVVHKLIEVDISKYPKQNEKNNISG